MDVFLGLFKKDLLYTINILLSLKISLVVALTFPRVHGFKKSVFFGIIGFFVIFLACGTFGLYLVGLLMLPALCFVYCLPKRYMNPISLAFYVIFMMFVRLKWSNEFGGLENVLVMLFTLKSIGLAHDVSNENILLVGSHSQCHLPLSRCKATFLDLICYFFCYCGLLTGPIYSYRTYYDMIHSVDGVYDEDDEGKSYIRRDRSPQWKRVFWNNLCLGIASAMVLGLLSSKDWLHLAQKTYAEAAVIDGTGYFRHFLWKYVYIIMYITLMKARYFSCWRIVEAGYNLVGLGAYPQVLQPRVFLPPKLAQKEVSNDAIRNSSMSYITAHGGSIYPMFFSLEVSAMINNWNPTVKYFMATYIGGMFPKFLRIAGILTFSAFWHGVGAGYYVGFYTTFFVGAAQRYLKNCYKELLPPSTTTYYDLRILLNDARQQRSFQKALFPLMAVFISNRLAEYSILPFFLVQSWQHTYRLWQDMFFFGHVAAVAMIMAGWLRTQFARPKVAP